MVADYGALACAGLRYMYSQTEKGLKKSVSFLQKSIRMCLHAFELRARALGPTTLSPGTAKHFQLGLPEKNPEATKLDGSCWWA